MSQFFFEDFGNISGLGINIKKTQAMILGHNSSTTNPVENKLGFEWVKQIQVLGVTLTCDLHIEH